MTDLADVWWDDPDDCPDLWHLDLGPHAHEDECPTCGQHLFGDADVVWPDDVIVSAESTN